MKASMIIDKYQTPAEVVRYMVNMLPADAIDILEPTPGNGNIVSELLKIDKNVYAPEDYFLLDKKLKFHAIVMNPPFSSKSLFIENAPEEYKNISGMKVGYNILFECMQKSNRVIALMPWFTISDSDVRMRAIKKYGLKSITVLPRKTFDYARIQTCVLELVKGWNTETIFHVFDCLESQKRDLEFNFN